MPALEAVVALDGSPLSVRLALVEDLPGDDT
jgi:hypothetical protein